MCDWFEDPFYKGNNFKIDLDFNIDKHFKKIHDEVNRNFQILFNNFDNFNQIDFPRLIENNFHNNLFPKFENLKEDKRDIHYSSITTSYQDGDLIHKKQRIYDNIKGNKYSETKQIGNRSVTWHRETDENGKSTESSILKNVNENDIKSFEIEFDQTINTKKNNSQKSLK
jgi:hypothetical protein